MRAGLDVRVWGALTAAKHARPHLRPGASITLTTGAAGRRPTAGWTVVATSCGALESLTRALAVELAPIRVNAVMAGMVRQTCGPDRRPSRSWPVRTDRPLPAVGRVGEPRTSRPPIST